MSLIGGISCTVFGHGFLPSSLVNIEQKNVLNDSAIVFLLVTTATFTHVP